MTKLVTLFTLVLAIGFLATSAAFAEGSVPAEAATPSEDTTTQASAEPILNLEEDPGQLFTPAKNTPHPDLTDEGDSLKLDQIRFCTQSQQAQCGPACPCIFVFPDVHCFC